MDFKVGDIVKIIESGFVGEIFSIENRLLTSLDGTIEGCCIDFYEVVGKNGESFRGLQGVELELIEKVIGYKKIKTQEQQKIEQLEQRIEKLEKEVFKPVEFHARPEETKPSLLTEDERVILSNINKEFKWIIRNEHYLTVAERKPRLDKYGWSVDGGLLADLPFIKLFKFIKFEDDEPYNIEELLKGE